MGGWGGYVRGRGLVSAAVNVSHCSEAEVTTVLVPRQTS